MTGSTDSHPYADRVSMDFFKKRNKISPKKYSSYLRGDTTEPKGFWVSCPRRLIVFLMFREVKVDLKAFWGEMFEVPLALEGTV